MDLTQETLNNYSWITSSDGKSIRPEAQDISEWPSYNKSGESKLRTNIKNLTFDCEGLKPNAVYKGDQLRIVWQYYDDKWHSWEDTMVFTVFDSFEEYSKTQPFSTRIRIKPVEVAKGVEFDRFENSEKQSDHIPGIGNMIGENPTARKNGVVETVEQSAGYWKNKTTIAQATAAVQFERLKAGHNLVNFDFFTAGAKWQLQNINWDEILELIASRAKTDPNWMNCIVDKQSILDCKEDILKLLNK
jgi:hypothetical protein